MDNRELEIVMGQMDEEDLHDDHLQEEKLPEQNINNAASSSHPGTDSLSPRPAFLRTLSRSKSKSRSFSESFAANPPKLHGTYHALSNEEVEHLSAIHGKNIVSAQKPVKWYFVLGRSIKHPFNAILACLATVAAITGDYRTMTVMILMVILSAAIRFQQELSSEIKAEALKKMVQSKATVIRLFGVPEDRDPTWEDVQKMNDDREMEISLDDIVPGDLIKLSAGDMVPGDCQLIASKELYISQSSLTGEAIPVEKFVVRSLRNEDPALQNPQPEVVVEESKEVVPQKSPATVGNEKKSLLERPDICLMGTSVVSGTGEAIVLYTGSKTLYGELAQKLASAVAPNAFDEGIKQVSYMFLSIMGIMMPAVLIVSGFVQGSWLEAFLFAIAVGVGLTPEMLPMIVNANLAKGAISMSRSKAIVKRLASIINFGAMDVLCTDKTGTLTQDKVVLIRHLDCEGHQYFPTLLYAFLNASFQTGLKNLLDVAVMNFYHEQNPQYQEVLDSYNMIDEVPFDFIRRRMSVVLAPKSGKGATLLVTKGALEEMLQVCTQYQTGNDDNIMLRPVTEAFIQHTRAIGQDLNEDGLRVVAVAYRPLAEHEECKNDKEHPIETALIFVGLLAFLDPPKETTAVAIKELMTLGITIKVLTGDSPLVCKRVCSQVGLPVNRIVTSNELQGLDDEQVAKIAEEGTIFARLAPLEKSRIVMALKRNKHIVGFLGDGINDAMALKTADIGISVDTATDVAKEAADILLLEKSLLVLARGVIKGRRTYCNTMKYIMMAVSSNFGNVFSMLAASAWLPFLPMLPIHIVFQNLLYDISQIAIPWDNVDADYLKVSHNWNPRMIIRFMVIFGPLSSIFDMTTFIFMWFYYGIQTPQDNTRLFQTAWFVEGLLTQTLIVHMIRSDKIPFIQSRASVMLSCFTVIIMIIGIALPFSPINTDLSMVPLPGLYFAYLIGALTGYCILTQIVKYFYLRKFHDWM